MGRPRRLVFCGATYHVMNRGNRKAVIFVDARDRRRFLRILIEELERYAVKLLAGCQMGNHFHCAVTTPRGNLSDFMERLESRFAQYSNWRHESSGHLFQGAFRDVLIEHDIHLLIALCYIFLNPVVAGLVEKPEDYRWSTYAATVGLAPLPSYVSIDWLEALFPNDTLKEAQSRFRELMSAADPLADYLRLNDTAAIDPNAVRRVIHSYTGEALQVGMLPRKYRSALRSSLPELLPDGMTPQLRAHAIYEAHVSNGYALAEIARELRIHPATVSKIYRSLRDSSRSDQ